MMSDNEFRELRLRATIVPSQSTWPEPEYVHWKALHNVADTIRTAMARTWAAIDAIEKDADLSVEGKKRKAQKIALQAITDLESDQGLAATRDAVDQVLEKWRAKAGAVIKRPVDQFEVSLHREIRAHVSSLQPRDRMKFIEGHADDVQMLSALLSVPAYLSNLSANELALAQAKASNHLDPQIVQEQDKVKRAMAEIEDYWPKVLKKIGERAGLVRDATGAWVVPPIAKAA